MSQVAEEITEALPPITIPAAPTFFNALLFVSIPTPKTVAEHQKTVLDAFLDLLAKFDGSSFLLSSEISNNSSAIPDALPGPYKKSAQAPGIKRSRQPTL